MIQAEPLYVVVTGEKENRRAHFASKFQNYAQAFAGAFAHDPAGPRVEEYQMITIGAHFNPGSRAFNVRMRREGDALDVDAEPRLYGFGYMNEFTPDSPEVVFHIWARDQVEAVATATEMRDKMVRNNWWPVAETVPE